MATSIGKDVQGFFVRLAGIGNLGDGPKHHFVGLGRIGSPSHYIQDGRQTARRSPPPSPDRKTSLQASFHRSRAWHRVFTDKETHFSSILARSAQAGGSCRNNTDEYRPPKNISQSLSYIDRCLLGKLLFFRAQRSHMNHERMQSLRKVAFFGKD